MTITDTRPEAAPGGAPVGAHVQDGYASDAPGLAAWLTTADHKRIGRLFAAFALLALVGLLVVGALLGIERIDPETADIFSGNDADQAAALYGFGVVFLGAVPLLLGLAIAIVPLQVGARTLAFPRAATAAFWTWLVAAGIFVASFIADGGPGGSDSDAVQLFLLSLGVLALALMGGGLCVATTVLALRSPGMSLRRVPAFSFASLVGATMLLLTLPVLVGQLVLLFVDYRYGQVAFGGTNGIFTRLDWVISQPQVLVYAVPALGFMADAVPVFARARNRKHVVTLMALGLFAVMGFGAFAQRWLYADVLEDPLFIGMTIVGTLAVLGVLGSVGTALRSGRPRLGGPFLFAMLGGLVLLGGVAVGVLTGFEDLELVGTTWQQGQMEAVVLGAAVLGGLGGLSYWGPKLWGRRLADGPVSGLALLGALGVVALAVPNLISGFVEQPAYLTAFDPDDTTEAMNAIAAVGAALLALTLLAFVLLALRGFRSGPVAADDVWEGGQTLEWGTSSPPPPGNFTGELPEVSSPAPLLDLREVPA